MYYLYVLFIGGINHLEEDLIVNPVDQVIDSDSTPPVSDEDNDDAEVLPEYAEFAGQSLYGGSKLTLGQAIRLIRSHVVRSQLNDRQHGRLLNLLKLLLPVGNICPVTLYKFERAEKLVSPPVEQHLMHCCGRCGKRLQEGFCTNAGCGECSRGARQWSCYGYGYSEPRSQFCSLLQGNYNF